MKEFVHVSKDHMGSAEFGRVLVKMLDQVPFVRGIDDKDTRRNPEIRKSFVEAFAGFGIRDSTRNIEIDNHIVLDLHEFRGGAEERDAESFAIHGQSFRRVRLFAVEFHDTGGAIAEEDFSSELFAESRGRADTWGAEEGDAPGGCDDGAAGDGVAEVENGTRKSGRKREALDFPPIGVSGEAEEEGIGESGAA